MTQRLCGMKKSTNRVSSRALGLAAVLIAATILAASYAYLRLPQPAVNIEYAKASLRNEVSLIRSFQRELDRGRSGRRPYVSDDRLEKLPELIAAAESRRKDFESVVRQRRPIAGGFRREIEESKNDSFMTMILLETGSIPIHLVYEALLEGTDIHAYYDQWKSSSEGRIFLAEAAKAREEGAWADARESNSFVEVNSFVEQFPNSQYRQAALELRRKVAIDLVLQKAFDASNDAMLQTEEEAFKNQVRARLERGYRPLPIIRFLQGTGSSWRGIYTEDGQVKTLNGQITREQEKAAIAILESIGLSGYQSWSKGVVVVVPRDGLQDVRAFMNDFFSSVVTGRARRDVEVMLFTRSGSKKFGSDWTQRVQYSTWDPADATRHYSSQQKPLVDFASDSRAFSYVHAYNFALNVFPKDPVDPDTSSVEAGIDSAMSESIDDLPRFPKAIDWSSLSGRGESDDREDLEARLPDLKLDKATIGAFFAYRMTINGTAIDRQQAIAGINDALNFETSRIRFAPEGLSSADDHAGSTITLP